MNPSRVLIADDDRAVRLIMERALQRDGHETRSTDKAATLWSWIDEGEGDLVITDVIMPDGNGLELLPRINARRPEMPVIVVSAHSTLMTAVKAAQSGAYDYLAKPFDIDTLCTTVARALADPHQPVQEQGVDEETPLIVGRSPAMQDIFRAIGRLASTDLTVMIEGESGSGKELVARALHDYGHRRGGPFVAVNMAAIPHDLIESELFGHERGAFTGASQRRDGRFAQAQGGTLFLDEIGDMPPEAQTRLLRVLQEGVFAPIGARQTIRTDTRIIAATHRDLSAAIRQGRFREDLFYRLNVVPIKVPALRERREDIGLLAQHFLQAAMDAGLPVKTISRDGIALLREHAWPGNVRELENLVRRLAALCANDTIGADDVAQHLTPNRSATRRQNETLSQSIEGQLQTYFENHGEMLPAPGLYDRMLRELERPLLALTLDATEGNQLKAAEILGINRNTLRKKLRDLDIEAIRGRGAGR
ncbi:MAG: nitrogen regulation protein NR(I) [Rhodospirillaceae bacterium]|jgi:two-component system, NtrC family, nitrogen regulation response regulator GlnG|nr:nitrogen regulation protein NR(I) [Rhodospirillaceae bacterium]MBT6512776.1 nitrogen regulation protein NR(I) [Rhodospirillaceae bacterium]MBT7614398.1 nitrogen regulation protein NR(I) [Rhodospirillaceae bacterium]MBT7646719.1 nitrogen regulation protein NR(I) [Rhodospirillaceae bacterium]